MYPFPPFLSCSPFSRPRFSSTDTRWPPSKQKNGRRKDKVQSSSIQRQSQNNARYVVSDLMKEVQFIQQNILAKLPSRPPATWQHIQDMNKTNFHHVEECQQIRMDLFRQTTALFRSLMNYVDAGVLNPAGIHQREVLALFTYILKFLGESLSIDDVHVTSQSSRDASPYQMSESILAYMRQWRLARDVSSYEQHSLDLAVREKYWAKASETFWNRIDPDKGASTMSRSLSNVDQTQMRPVDIDVLNPIGLFAIARHAQERNIAIVESVFDAVQTMIMWSPNESKQCEFATECTIL
jgi:hypothetical protein